MSDHPSTNWGQFSMQVLALLRQIPTSEPQDAPSFDLDRTMSDQLVFELAEAEAPVCNAIDHAIREWPDSPSPWDGLSGLALYFLRLRLDTSLQFTLQFCFSGHHPETSFLDFPADYPRSDMARFIFIDWWKTHGRTNAAHAMIADYHDERIAAQHEE
jgi:hypothetical protein